MKIKKKYINIAAVFTLAAVMAVNFTGCGKTVVITSNNSSQEISEAEKEKAGENASEDTVSENTGLESNRISFSKRDASDSYDGSSPKIVFDGAEVTASGEGVTGEENTVTIHDEGEWILTGNTKTCTIVIEAEKSDKIHLVLDNFTVTSETKPCIYVKSADKVFVTLADGSTNSLTVTGTFEPDGGTNLDAAVFAKDDISFNGTGKLVIISTGNGIACKNNLVIAGGEYDITAKGGHGLQGKDSVKIRSGTISVNASSDGIHAGSDEEGNEGYCYIAGGDIKIESSQDGIQAAGIVRIDDGIISLKTGGGSSAKASKNREGKISLTESCKGIKSAVSVEIYGGTIGIDSLDDAIHSNDTAGIFGGIIEISTGDDGVHADKVLTVSGSSLSINKSYEGLEAEKIYIKGGTISVVSSDDGVNASSGGGDQFGGFGGWGGPGGRMGGNSECVLEISGGKLVVNAGGDGVDSNGSLAVSGGEIYVSGPTDSMNGAIDYESEAVITGGIIIACGASGMDETFTEAKNQGVIRVRTSSKYSGGTEVILKDSSGNAILSFTPETAFNSIVVSVPEIQDGNSYKIEVGTQTISVKMSGLLYSEGGSSGPGGWSGGPGGPGGNPGGSRPGRR